MEELSEAIKHDVRTVIDNILRNSEYETFYLIGKSLGTIALTSELKREIFKEAKVVWLTPLIHRDDVLNTMVNSNNKGLSFIGDNDRCYTAARCSQLMNNTNLVSKLFPNINHSMEYDNDPVKSIDVLRTVIEEINRF